MPNPARSLTARLLLLCAPLALLCASSSAQPNAVRVLYSREMPRVVRQKMPRGYKSRFFGACKLPSLKQEVLFHLSSRAEYIPGFAELTYRLHRFTLDLFTRDKRGRETILQKLNTTTFEFKGGFDRVRADVMWIDPKTRCIPALKIQTRFSDAPYHGFDVLIPFPKGLKQPAYAQAFESGGNNAWAFHHTFDKLDDRDFALVTQVESSSERLVRTDWRWDGEKFVASEPKILY